MDSVANQLILLNTSIVQMQVDLVKAFSFLLQCRATPCILDGELAVTTRAGFFASPGDMFDVVGNPNFAQIFATSSGPFTYTYLRINRTLYIQGNGFSDNWPFFFLSWLEKKILTIHCSSSSSSWWSSCWTSTCCCSCCCSYCSCCSSTCWSSYYSSTCWSSYYSSTCWSSYYSSTSSTCRSSCYSSTCCYSTACSCSC